MENFDLSKYINIALRRKYWIIISFLLVLLAGLTYLLKAPKIYESKTLILVQEQKVPQEFVRSIVSSDAEDRLRTITQQVTSRTNLEKIISENKLYNEETEMLLEEKVALLSKNVNIDVARGGRGGGSAFSISFQGKEPRKVMQVTNDLAYNFIDANIKIRETQAMGTSEFLADELKDVRQRLQEKEELLKDYKEKHRGGLPEQLQTNLSILGRLQAQLEQLNSNLRDAENRKLILQQGISSNISGEPGVSGSAFSSPLTELERLKNELEALSSKYTEKHPDIISLKKRIAALEASGEAVQETEPDQGTNEQINEPVTVNQALRLQLKNIDLEIAGIREEINEVNKKINYYDRMVAETPKREQELLSLNRDYASLNEQYQSMLDRQWDAEISVSMERKQKGEQFKVIDPAQIPLKPIKPDAKKIMLMTLALGLGLGCGIAYLLELMDTSYKTPDEAGNDLNIPVLASIPLLVTEYELRSKKRKEIFKGISIALGFFIAASGIVIAAKGFDKTLEFVKGLIGG